MLIFTEKVQKRFQRNDEQRFPHAAGRSASRFLTSLHTAGSLVGGSQHSDWAPWKSHTINLRGINLINVAGKKQKHNKAYKF